MIHALLNQSRVWDSYKLDVMHKAYCRHRFTTMKRWQVNDKWFAIQHCRWCDKWQRKTIEISESSMKSTPKVINEAFIVIEPDKPNV